MTAFISNLSSSFPGHTFFDIIYEKALNILKKFSHLQIAQPLALLSASKVVIKKKLSTKDDFDIQTFQELAKHPAYEVRYQTLKSLQRIGLDQMAK